MRGGCGAPEFSQQEIAKTRWICSTAKMQTFELHPLDDGFELSGGQLQAPMVFHGEESRDAIHFAEFLSQREGGVLRIFDALGELTETRRFKPDLSTPKTGGLHRRRP